MTLAELRKQAAADYGLPWSNTPDPLFGQNRMTAFVNKAHRELAVEARLYRRTLTADLPAASSGLSTVAINALAWEVDREKVMVLNGSEWVPVRWRDEDTLRAAYGPFENDGGSDLPAYFFMRTSDTANSHRQLCLFPGATAAVTNGLRYDAWMYPDDLSTDTSEPVFGPTALHSELLPIICLHMAMFEASGGRRDAQVAMWADRARKAIENVKHKTGRLRTPGTRSAHLRAADLW